MTHVVTTNRKGKEMPSIQQRENNQASESRQQKSEADSYIDNTGSKPSEAPTTRVVETASVKQEEEETTRYPTPVPSETATDRIESVILSDPPTTKISMEALAKDATERMAQQAFYKSSKMALATRHPIDSSGVSEFKDSRCKTTKTMSTGIYDHQARENHNVAQRLSFSLQSSPAQRKDALEPLLGEYRLLEKIGSGAMGSVYTAEQIRLRRIVAIKMLSQEFCKDSFYIKRFRLEMQSAAQLNHPNIVQIYDAGEVQDQLFYAMEYVKGESVGMMIQRMKKIPLKIALGIVLHMTNALKEIYEAQIVHRDIKPENILVTLKGVAKLADLGLAKNVDYAKDLQADEEDLMMGTPYYIAPEQIQSASSVDHRADIYSLGATFYAMLTGIVPFYNKHSRIVLMQVLRQALPPVKEIDSTIPEAVSRLVSQMMDKNPDKRFQLPQELLEALEEVQKQI